MKKYSFLFRKVRLPITMKSTIWKLQVQRFRNLCSLNTKNQKNNYPIPRYWFYTNILLIRFFHLQNIIIKPVLAHFQYRGKVANSNKGYVHFESDPDPECWFLIQLKLNLGSGWDAASSSWIPKSWWKRVGDQTQGTGEQSSSQRVYTFQDWRQTWSQAFAFFELCFYLPSCRNKTSRRN